MWLKEAKLLNMNYHTHKNKLNPKYEPRISKIERVTAILVSQVEAKSQIHKINILQNLTDFLRFLPNFFAHVKLI